MNISADRPRLVIAGMAGDSGKTLVSLGLILLMREKGLAVRAFKKGPDYIDAAWLSWASGAPARNLDSYLMGFSGCAGSFSRSALIQGINIIEGNRGLYDGSDARGTHSTAELAKSLKAPVLLIVNAAKVTRTAAAGVLGCLRFDPQVHIAGVILNQVSGRRHEGVIRSAIEEECGLPVLGVLPRAAGNTLLPARHLGLVTPDEHPRIGELRDNVIALIRDGVDLDRIVALAGEAEAIPAVRPPVVDLPGARGIKIGLLRDSAFSFYYPENLEILEQSGASLVHTSALTDVRLPHDLDALYIGGGFPETHGAALSANRSFLTALRIAAAQGLPVYAECGGLMLLSQAVRWNQARFPMSGVFPFEVEVSAAPEGHGYVELLVDQSNPFFPPGLLVRGHEFHYSRIVPGDASMATACAVRRGTGCGHGRDGLILGNVWAAYTHVHALGTPEWAGGMLTAAAQYSRQRSG